MFNKSRVLVLRDKTSEELIEDVIELEDKVEKLKSLLNLTDPVVSMEIVSKQTVTQWNEYVNCYPEEGV